MSACASTVPEPSSDIKIEIIDATVWFDHMPGMKERGYASFDMKLTNTGNDTLSISEAIGSIRNRRNVPPIRKFSCSAEKDGQAVKDLQLLPSKSYEYRFRSTAGYIPFDIGRYPIVMGAVTLMLSNGNIIRAEKAKIEVFIAQ